MLQRFNKRISYFKKALLPDGKNHWPYDPEEGEDSYRDWLAEVTDPGTGLFYTKKEPVPFFDDNGNEVPEKRTFKEIQPRRLNQNIVRIRVNGEEFLYSIGMIEGFSQYGDPIQHKFRAPEMWLEPTFRHHRAVDSTDNKIKDMIEGPGEVKEHYAMPFNKENFLKLYNERDPSRQLKLVLKDYESGRVTEWNDPNTFLTNSFDTMMDLNSKKDAKPVQAQPLKSK